MSELIKKIQRLRYSRGLEYQAIETAIEKDIEELEQANQRLRGLMSEALSNMEYYSASLGEYWLVTDRDIEALQAALLEGTGDE